MADAEQFEELVEHLERVITTLAERVDRLEQGDPAAAPYTLSQPMRAYAPPAPVGFYGRMAPMDPR